MTRVSRSVLGGLCLTAVFAFAPAIGASARPNAGVSATPLRLEQSVGQQQALVHQARHRRSERRYNNRRHGRRHRRRQDGFSHFYLGWWYADPWWEPRRYSRSNDRCAYWSDRCVDNWGYRNPDYWGCMRYYGCD